MRYASILRFLSACSFIVVALVPTGAAWGQATRTWVSGVGDDANPCSRTAPCKTFAGAISKTATGGEINVLDPGGFGAVTITKSITISAEGVEAGVLVSGTNGVVINAPATAVVVLRGLDIEGLGTGLNGIRFLAGGVLHVENCTINNFTERGIDFEPSGPTPTELFVKDSAIRNNAVAAGTNAGIFVKPGAGGAKVSLFNVRLENNHQGMRIDGGTQATVTNSVASGNTVHGFLAMGTAAGPAELTLESSVASNNASNGVRSFQTGAVIRLSNTIITGNVTGLSVTSGEIISAGNNSVFGNGTDGVPTSTVPQI